eukprot:7004864-Prymnesium_polylepis.1
MMRHKAVLERYTAPRCLWARGTCRAVVPTSSGTGQWRTKAATCSSLTGDVVHGGRRRRGRRRGGCRRDV